METFYSPVIIISLKIIVEVKRGTAVKEEEQGEKIRWTFRFISIYLSGLIAAHFFPFHHADLWYLSCVKHRTRILWLTCTCLQLSVWWFLTCEVSVHQPGWCLRKNRSRIDIKSGPFNVRIFQTLCIHLPLKYFWFCISFHLLLEVCPTQTCLKYLQPPSSPSTKTDVFLLDVWTSLCRMMHEPSATPEGRFSHSCTEGENHSPQKCEFDTWMCEQESEIDQDLMKCDVKTFSE